MEDSLSRIEAALRESPQPRPVGSWSPAREVSIDIRIAPDGTWHHEGTPIGRERLVKLFASVLRREPDGRYCLVTPAEKAWVSVDDAPFLAVHMDVGGAGPQQVIGLRTNVDDYVRVDAEHPLRFVREPDSDGLKPYVHVRDGLEALVTRAVAYDLLELGNIEPREDDVWFGIWSAGTFFPVARAGELE